MHVFEPQGAPAIPSALNAVFLAASAGSMALAFPAVHSFMRRVLAKYAGEQQSRAKAWLKWIKARHALLAAMCADAAEETSLLTHWTDSETADSAQLSSVLSAVISRCVALFGDDEACFTTECYTSKLAASLRSENLSWLDNKDKQTHKVGTTPHETSRPGTLQLLVFLNRDPGIVNPHRKL